MDHTTTISEFLQDLIFRDFQPYCYGSPRPEYPMSFYVHISLMKKLEKRLNAMLSKDDWEMFEQTLRVGTEYFEMCQIIIPCGSEEQLYILDDLIRTSQFAFLLEENPTLFINVEAFHFMTEFIREHKLKPYILSREEMVGITTGDVTIKVVTFNKNVYEKFDIIAEYFKMLRNIDRNWPMYYFMTFRHPWEYAPILRKGHLNDVIYSVFPIILRHLGSVNNNYQNELNIMNLLSLRLALGDVRRSFQGDDCILRQEIDFFIKLELNRTVKNNHFDLKEYLIAKNCLEVPLLTSYLMYEFQEFFKFVSYKYVSYEKGSTKTITDVIKLKNERNSLSIIKEKFNIKFRVEGDGFDRMSTSLFFDLIQCRNVSTINLDTNYEWFEDAPHFDQIITVGNKNGIGVYLDGDNAFKFAENCIGVLKKFEFILLDLYVGCNMHDYTIFDQLCVKQIYLQNTKINASMLNSLQQCTIKSPLLLFPSAIENSWQTWGLLNNLDHLQRLYIPEDEGTWLSMAEFIINELRTTNLQEFQFKIKNIVVKDSSQSVNVNSIKFTFDDDVTKLEIRDVDSNELVDLYNRKFGIEADDKSDFEFYQ